jgi:predicted amidohydrolase
MDHNAKTIRVAAIQLSPVLMNRDATTEKVVKAIEKCGREGIRLAVFPETIIPGRIFSD